jgi:putative ABC transport system substrate-binding protein
MHPTSIAVSREHRRAKTDHLDTELLMRAFLGWLRGEKRHCSGEPDSIPKSAAEPIALAPDVILSTSGTNLPALMAATRTVPIVFVRVADPVGAGFVESLARPGGNVTGFIVFEYGISSKWLELLKEIAPGVQRVAILRDPRTAAGIGQFGALQSAAPATLFAHVAAPAQVS